MYSGIAPIVAFYECLLFAIDAENAFISLFFHEFSRGTSFFQVGEKLIFSFAYGFKSNDDKSSPKLLAISFTA